MVTVQGTFADTDASSATRKAWVTPKLDRLEAEAAQLLTGVTDDGPGDKS